MDSMILDDSSGSEISDLEESRKQEWIDWRARSYGDTPPVCDLCDEVVVPRRLRSRSYPRWYYCVMEGGTYWGAACAGCLGVQWRSASRSRGESPPRGARARADDQQSDEWKRKVWQKISVKNGIKTGERLEDYQFTLGPRIKLW